MGKFDKIKYLYVNGDSWSRGDDLPQDETLPDYPGGPMGRPIGRYSDVLGEKFGWEVINESMGGGSNDRTVRKMIDWFAKNKDKWEETFVIICWTQYTREELWNDVMGCYETQQFQSTDLDKREGEWFGEQADEMLIQSDADLKPTKDWWKTYLINFYNFDKRSQSMIRQIIFLQSFLKANNVPYYFHNAFSNDAYTHSDWIMSDWSVGYDEEKWKEIISMIDYNFYHPNSFMTCTELWEGEGLIEENKGLYEITGDKGGHPTPISHKLFAEELYKCIKEKF